MPILNNVDAIFRWVMALLRAGALVSVLPVFSAQPVPVQMRLALAVFLAYLAASYVPDHAALPEQPALLALVAGNEALLGIFMGLIVRVIFFAAEMAGQIISSEMGLTTGNTFDPNSGNSFTPTSVMLSNLAALLLLTTGTYRNVLFAYLRSYRYAPIGNLGFNPAALDLFVTQTGNIFGLAVQMCAPIIAVNFVVPRPVAQLGRGSPGLHGVKASNYARHLAGLTVLGLTISLAAQYMLGYLEKAPDLMLQLVRR